ncbi:MAG: sensor histidine kinase [Mucilaginibacter polytrichastri]|nr:sensor histidine kinase [Mucilaginibacter polytrichastri]
MATDERKAFLRNVYRIKTSDAVIHVAGCIFFLFLPLLFPFGQNGSSNAWAILFSHGFLFFYFFFVAIFYLHTYLLIPQLFFTGKKTVYTVALIALLSLVYFLRPFDRLSAQGRNDRAPAGQFGSPPPPRPFEGQKGEMRPPPPPREGRDPGMSRRGPRFDIISFFLFGTIITMGFAIQTGRKWRATEQRAARAEADKVSAELSFLKAQINPHFLFNTLNNLYALAVMNSEHTADSIMKLSNIMRYVTDDTSQDFVPLQKEIDCITDYIVLQKLRLSSKVNLYFETTGVFTHKNIAPLILMTFVENAFKYGVSNHQPSQISVMITAEKHTLTFLCSNTLFNQERRYARSGIGLENTRKRLLHLYPNRHLLDISTEEGRYTTRLTLRFQTPNP